MNRTLAIRILVAGIVCGVAGCAYQGADPSASPGSSPGSSPGKDRGPAVHRPELANLPDPVPKIEPKARYGNHSPYVVFGKTYEVMATVGEYQTTGVASWYGEKFQGRRTSSGEPYDMFALTAAHRSLPLPSYLRVTNLDNGRTTVVRVNDRGPFHEDRVIDLSYAGAVKLGFVDHGTARVRLDLLRPQGPLAPPVTDVVAGPVPAEPAPQSPLATQTEIYLQAGAFSRRQGAEQMQADLAAVVGPGVHIDRQGRDALFRVRVGPIDHMGEATRLQNLIVGAQLGVPLIIREHR